MVSVHFKLKQQNNLQCNMQSMCLLFIITTLYSFSESCHHKRDRRGTGGKMSDAVWKPYFLPNVLNFTGGQSNDICSWKGLCSQWGADYSRSITSSLQQKPKVKAIMSVSDTVSASLARYKSAVVSTKYVICANKIVWASFQTEIPTSEGSSF